MAEFGEINTRVEVNKWVPVSDVEPMKSGGYTNIVDLAPYSVKVTFVDGEPSDIQVYGKQIRKDGVVSNRSMQVPGVWLWDKAGWPTWLQEAYALVLADFRSNLLVMQR